MEFFENAVEKAKEAFDVVCKKTGDVVSVSKQKIDIASIETKLSKDYEKLGKLYYDMIKNSETPDENITKLKNDIAKKIETVKTLKTEINNAKNKRICPVCGASIDKNSVYCNICGAKLEIEFSEEDNGNE